MLGRFEGLSDIEWKLFEEIFPISPEKRGKCMPHTPFRYVLNTLLYILLITGHSTIIYSKRAFHDLGYYDNTGFGGDTEYLQRFISCYGNQKIADVKKVLTIAYFAN
jgi:hypothetical protein